MIRIGRWLIGRPIRYGRKHPWVWPEWRRIYTGGWRFEVGPIAIEYVPPNWWGEGNVD